jgi:hypothetical protein
MSAERGVVCPGRLAGPMEHTVITTWMQFSKAVMTELVVAFCVDAQPGRANGDVA